MKKTSTKIKPFILLSSALLMFSQTSCIPVAIVGGASVVGYNASKDRTIGTTVDDTGIEAAINAKYIAAKSRSNFTAVSIKSVDRRVLLTGHVPTREAKIEAYNIAFDTKGVEEVLNEITVDKDAHYTASEIASDTWISTQVKSHLLFAKDVSGVNYTTETIQGTVYLMGIAQNQAELNAATKIASEVSGVKKVVSYVRISGSNANVKPNGQSNVNRNSTSTSQTPAQGSSGYKKPEDVIIEDSPNAK